MMSQRQLKTYEFTLVLKNVSAETAGLEDSLFEAGCDDALINVRNGTVYLDFDRPAKSLEDAVLSAIKDVEASSSKALVASVAPEDYVTEADIAQRLKTNRQTVSLWIKGSRRARHTFPKPVMKLAGRSPFWKWVDVVNWLYKNGIITDPDLVQNAEFIEDINAVLEERHRKIKKSRRQLLKKLQFGAV